MSNEEYKQIIIEIIKKIEDQQILISIYTVAKKSNRVEGGELIPCFFLQFYICNFLKLLYSHHLISNIQL